MWIMVHMQSKAHILYQTEEKKTYLPVSSVSVLCSETEANLETELPAPTSSSGLWGGGQHETDEKKMPLGKPQKKLFFLVARPLTKAFTEWP